MKKRNKETEQSIITQKAIEIADIIKKSNNITNVLKNFNYYERRSFLYILYEQLNLTLFDLEIREMFDNDCKTNT